MYVSACKCFLVCVLSLSGGEETRWLASSHAIRLTAAGARRVSGLRRSRDNAPDCQRLHRCAGERRVEHVHDGACARAPRPRARRWVWSAVQLVCVHVCVCLLCARAFCLFLCAHAHVPAVFGCRCWNRGGPLRSRAAGVGGIRRPPQRAADVYYRGVAMRWWHLRAVQCRQVRRASHGGAYTHPGRARC